MKRLSKLRLGVAILAGAGVVGSFTVLAVAAPEVEHRGAAAAVYCFPKDKAARKASLDHAKSAASDADAAAQAAAEAVKNARNALTRLVSTQAKARAAYWKTHRQPKQRAAFLAAQMKAQAKLKAMLNAALSAASDANAVATQAHAAEQSAKSAFDRCS
jgi:hypothetical protein